MVGDRVKPVSYTHLDVYKRQTLTNICKYFDFNWWKQNGNVYKIKPYEYPRRHTEEGEMCIRDSLSEYPDAAGSYSPLLSVGETDTEGCSNEWKDSRSQPLCHPGF